VAPPTSSLDDVFRFVLARPPVEAAAAERIATADALLAKRRRAYTTEARKAKAG
jgi:hypothetical protein